MGKVYTPFSDQKSLKAIPFGVAHSYTPRANSLGSIVIALILYTSSTIKLHQVNHRQTNIWSGVSVSSNSKHHKNTEINAENIW